MKKTVISIFLLLFAISSFAQNEHATFMDIPLDGTIDQFHKKLVAAGYKHDSIESRNLPVGSRAFYGIYAGINSKLNVSYDETSKIVYKISVSTYCRDIVRDSIFNMIKGCLDEKYGSHPPLKRTDLAYDAYQYLESSKTDKIIDESIL